MFGSALTLIVVLFTLRHHGPFAIAAALVALELPVVLGSPLVGWLVDSWPNRRLMVVALAVQAATSAGLAFLLGNVAAAVLLLFLLGTGTALTAPAASALIPQVTGEDAATRGYALFATVRVAATLVGSTAGGVLVAGPGPRVALLIDAGTFAVQAGLLLLVHTERDPRGDPTPANTPGGHALAGLGHLHRQRILLFAVLGLGVMVTAAVLVNVAEVFFVTAVLQAGAAVLGVLGTCWGLGMVAGSRLAGKLTSSRALIMGLCLGGMVMGAGLLAPAVAPTLPVTVLGWIAGGLGNGAQNVTVQALARLHTPDPLRGRVFAATGAILVTGSLSGTVLAAPVVATFGARTTLAAAGTGSLSAAIAVLLLLAKQLRGHNTTG